MSGTRATWKEMLAIYAIKTNMDSANPQEIVTMDNNKKELLSNIFWEMNEISSKTESKTNTEKQVIDDKHSGDVKSETTVTKVYLCIIITNKTVEQMADKYAFSSEQQKSLSELLDSKYDDMWKSVLNGISNYDGEIIISNSDYIGNDIFSWPLPENFNITSQFGSRIDPFSDQITFHGGLDIAAPEGTPILASADGVVHYANSTDPWAEGSGYYVMIKHNGTYTTLYGHCSQVFVTTGQQVKKGQVIACVGSTGNSTGNHLHFTVYKNGEKVNPLNYFE